MISEFYWNMLSFRLVPAAKKWKSDKQEEEEQGYTIKKMFGPDRHSYTP